MRIAVFGAAGQIGSRVLDEALARSHEVTAVVRNAARSSKLPAATRAHVGDASRVEDVVRVSRDHDLVISATRPPAGSEGELVRTTKALLSGVGQTGIRLLLVGGAASLNLPGDEKGTVLDDRRLVPAARRPIAQACADQLEVCRAEKVADWTYLSPPAALEPGERTGTYRLGCDELVVDPNGVSRISVEDFAVALMDEAERPRHRRTRFTVAY